ncbi:MAG TPA: SCO family protein [Stenomitos sp.]
MKKWVWIVLIFLAANVAGFGVYRALNAPHALPDVPLVDQNGKATKWSDYRGKTLVVFFGYTNCPDACPTALTDLDKELRQLGPEAAKIQGLFVSLDPARDTTARLKTYVPYFNPTFVGLRPAESDLAALVKQFGVIYQKATPSADGNYLIDHSLRYYVIAPDGTLRTSFLLPAPPAELKQALGLTP